VSKAAQGDALDKAQPTPLPTPDLTRFCSDGPKNGSQKRFFRLAKFCSDWLGKKIVQQPVREAVIRGSSSRGATSRARRYVSFSGLCAVAPRLFTRASTISAQDVAHLNRQFIRTERLLDECRSWAENPDINCVIL